MTSLLMNMKKGSLLAFFILNISFPLFSQLSIYSVLPFSEISNNVLIPDSKTNLNSLSSRFKPSTKLRRRGFVFEGIGIALVGVGTAILVDYQRTSYVKPPGSKDSYPPDLWKQFFGVGLCINGGLCMIGGSTMIFFGQRQINKEKKKLSFNLSPFSASLTYRL